MENKDPIGYRRRMIPGGGLPVARVNPSRHRLLAGARPEMIGPLLSRVKMEL